LSFWALNPPNIIAVVAVGVAFYAPSQKQVVQEWTVDFSFLFSASAQDHPRLTAH
jgi:D-tyrosyl-tRNA(Tyr) deacylase